MADSCGCEDEVFAQQKPIDQCLTTFNETVFVQAEVTITPDVEIGDINFICVDGSIIGACRGKLSPKKACTFEVNQKICVEIPLKFSAKAIAVPKGIVCGTPKTGKCRRKHVCKSKISFLGAKFGLFVQNLVKKNSRSEA